MDNPQAQQPEGLNYLTALSSMKVIRQIFDHIPSFDGFCILHIEAPFLLLDYNSFEKSIHHAGTTDPVIKNKLAEIRTWAAGNVKIFNERRNQKNISAIQERYYFINGSDDAIQVNTVKGIENIGSTYKGQHPLLSELPDFCQKVHVFAVQCLENPFKPKLQISRSGKGKGNKLPKSFIDYLDTDNNNNSLEYLKSHFAGQKGQAIAYMIHSLNQIHALNDYDLMNLHKAIAADFGNIGTYQSIEKQGIPDQTSKPKQYKKYKATLSKVSLNITRYTL
jgi:hypothetical protein